VAVAPSLDAHANGERYRINAAYVHALEDAGLAPLVIPPLGASGMAEHLLAVVDGLVLTGGMDVDPALYGESRHVATGMPTPARDEWEMTLSTVARSRGLPTLAICRGMQVLNVALGGALLQDIATQRPGSLQHNHESRTARVHEIEVDRESRLANLLGTTQLAVNSMHHQAINQPSHQLEVTAMASDGIIEACEWPGDDWWMIAVQWHPEELFEDEQPWDRNLFHGFAAAVRDARAMV
jgi:putative glutamine amidotransferase